MEIKLSIFWIVHNGKVLSVCFNQGVSMLFFGSAGFGFSVPELELSSAKADCARIVAKNRITAFLYSLFIRSPLYLSVIATMANLKNIFDSFSLQIVCKNIKQCF